MGSFKYIPWRKDIEYVTTHTYRTPDGYRGSIVQVKKINDQENIREIVARHPYKKINGRGAK